MDKPIGLLPKSLEIDNKAYDISTDFRVALSIIQMYNDGAISPAEKSLTMLNILFTTKSEDGNLVTNIPENIDLAKKEAMWFINIGEYSKESMNEEELLRDIEKQLIESGDKQELDAFYENVKLQGMPILDYKKDEHLIFSAVNAVAGKEVRSEEYMHWWTFYGLCQAIDSESTISTIMSIRSKIKGGKKLEDYEKTFLKENEKLILFTESEDKNEEDWMILEEKKRISKLKQY